MNSLSFYLSEKVFISFSILKDCFIGYRILGQCFLLSKHYIFHSTLFFAGWLLMRWLSSVAQLSLTLCDPMDCSMPGFPVHHELLELAQTMSIESVIPSNHLILCRPLLLPPSIFISIRVFSNESALCIRWPKYWNFSFSICTFKVWFPLR